jgi:tRNA A37 threonylcarbamoyladenosine dehydratase
MSSERFAGIDRLYGAGTLGRFARAHVAVIGIGGVGSWAIEALARSGIGRLTLIDGDEVCVSNTNRQIQALDGSFGRAKVAAMSDRIAAIAPGCVVDCRQAFITPDNVRDMVPGDLTYLVDACDNVRAKVALIAHAKRRKLPVITIGAAGGRIDPARVDSRDLAKTVNDPLLAEVRRRLRDEHGWTRNPKRYFGVQAIYSLEQPRYVQPDGSVACMRDPDAREPLRLDCTGGFGAATHVTASFAMLAVARVLDRMLERTLV